MGRKRKDTLVKANKHISRRLSLSASNIIHQLECIKSDAKLYSKMLDAVATNVNARLLRGVVNELQNGLSP